MVTTGGRFQWHVGAAVDMLVPILMYCIMRDKVVLVDSSILPLPFAGTLSILSWRRSMFL